MFICECCGATLKKQQIDRHCETKCRNAWSFTCVECGKTLDGFDYKEHNVCMTEVEKYQGKFLERQRQAKLQAKQDKKVEKVTKSAAAEQDDESEEKKKSASHDHSEEEISEREQIRLRKFLEDGCEFKGLASTAVAILKKEESR